MGEWLCQRAVPPFVSHWKVSLGFALKVYEQGSAQVQSPLGFVVDKADHHLIQYHYPASKSIFRINSVIHAKNCKISSSSQKKLNNLLSKHY